MGNHPAALPMDTQFLNDAVLAPAPDQGVLIRDYNSSLRGNLKHFEKATWNLKKCKACLATIILPEIKSQGLHR